MGETTFKRKVYKKIKAMLPGAMILNTNPRQIQGIPDTVILYNDRWAMLEFKRASNASHRRNQDYYVDLLDEMSFAAFIFPENEEEILDALQRTLCY